jgi:hypothetical protein
VQSHEEAAAELRWFWRESSGELGLRSNFTSLVARLEGGGPMAVSTELDNRRIQAARRARGIQTALDELSAADWRVLWLAFGADGAAAGTERLWLVALETEVFGEEYRRSHTTRPPLEWLRRVADAARRGEWERRRLWTKIQASAEQELGRALSTYLVARHAQTP